MNKQIDINVKEISIVIGTYNRKNFLKKTILTLREEVKDLNYEIIIVDGGSNDGTINWVSKQKDILLLVQHNRGTWYGKGIERKSWGYFMNLGFRMAHSEYICMLSDDCLVVPGAIKNALSLIEKNKNKIKLGGVAFYWRNWPEQTKYNVGYTFGDKLFINHGIYIKSALVEVNYVEEDKYFFYHADGDLCLKMWQKGFEVIASQNSFIEHYSHANKRVRLSNLDSQSKDWISYKTEWRNLLDTKSSNREWDYLLFRDPFKTYLRFLPDFIFSSGLFVFILKKIRKVIVDKIRRNN